MKRADRTALSVIVVLFDHNKSLRNHRDTRTLEHYPILSHTFSVMPRETLKHTARGSAHASEPKSRRKVHDERVHETKLPKDPVIVVGGGELVARELAAREHHPTRTCVGLQRGLPGRRRAWQVQVALNRCYYMLNRRRRFTSAAPSVLGDAMCAPPAVSAVPDQLNQCCHCTSTKGICTSLNYLV